ncbi:hypothetical protein LAZ67_2003686 [Cordylochernes scorpioides]|uniref:Intermembrane lipid transfer protein VPS13-like C-terminal domain-containing protein n=1 Tax=Cordylochernes scorpioides TaxID=51811 RepID=A0ABY6K617_9ARAC|nr:hypothetical protein LAZ67_2003686 [Cordylochernes scorpioides]
MLNSWKIYSKSRVVFHQGLKPYSPFQASGYRLLQHLSKGHYADTDVYWAHAALSQDPQTAVALITDKHVFLLEKCRFWGGWDIQWAVRVDDIISIPVVADQRLIITVRQVVNLYIYNTYCGNSCIE